MRNHVVNLNKMLKLHLRDCQQHHHLEKCPLVHLSRRNYLQIVACRPLKKRADANVVLAVNVPLVTQQSYDAYDAYDACPV